MTIAAGRSITPAAIATVPSVMLIRLSAGWLSSKLAFALRLLSGHLYAAGGVAPTAFANQKRVYYLLMRAAAAALQKLALDPRYLGGRLAGLAVLHTWTRAMLYHPHVHLLVPATFATELRGRQVHEYDIADLLGHTIQSVTGTYARSTPEALEDAVNRLTEPRGAVLQFKRKVS